ncbi:uncharacterized protein LOC105782789 [Gossypium raimondii]|uniref:uncharacterized protein LOC105782789 n=1 Tax=Gossypium raimondii TaxID=29730 RepID=UPI00227A268A|nr:uncharacterized protein LOC105782789 [Gossypium raimondii]
MLALDRAQETKSSLRTVPSVVGGLATLFRGYFAVSTLYTWSIKQGRVGNAELDQFLLLEHINYVNKTGGSNRLPVKERKRLFGRYS